MAILKNTVIADTGFIQIPTGTAAQRPVNPVIGDFRYNSEEESFEVYNGEDWLAVGSSGEPEPEPISQWEILMRVNGRKSVSRNETPLGNPGTSTFMSMTEASTGAGARSSINDSEGLYTAFFNKTNITKIAFIDGTTSDRNPTSHNNYLIYDLVQSTGNESINAILKRLDIYQRDSSGFHNNDSVWGSSSVLNHTAGTNGYSGLLSASSGNGFRDQSGVIPGRFCVMGINRDSDNDIQSLCAFSGNLQSGKGDSWRGNNPSQTFWSYWGHDFHASSQSQRIGSSRQTPPGVSDGASWTGSVYMLGFSQ